MKNHGMKRW